MALQKNNLGLKGGEKSRGKRGVNRRPLREELLNAIVMKGNENQEKREKTHSLY